MAKLTGEMLHKATSSGLFIPPIAFLGVDLPNIIGLSTYHDPITDGISVGWRTKDMQVHRMTIPWGEISTDEVQALLVAMRMS